MMKGDESMGKEKTDVRTEYFSHEMTMVGLMLKGAFGQKKAEEMVQSYKELAESLEKDYGWQPLKLQTPKLKLVKMPQKCRKFTGNAQFNPNINPVDIPFYHVTTIHRIVVDKKLNKVEGIKTRVIQPFRWEIQRLNDGTPFSVPYHQFKKNKFDMFAEGKVLSREYILVRVRTSFENKEIELTMPDVRFPDIVGRPIDLRSFENSMKEAAETAFFGKDKFEIKKIRTINEHEWIDIPEVRLSKKIKVVFPDIASLDIASDGFQVKSIDNPSIPVIEIKGNYEMQSVLIHSIEHVPLPFVKYQTVEAYKGSIGVNPVKFPVIDAKVDPYNTVMHVLEKKFHVSSKLLNTQSLHFDYLLSQLSLDEITVSFVSPSAMNGSFSGKIQPLETVPLSAIHIEQTYYSEYEVIPSKVDLPHIQEKDIMLESPSCERINIPLDQYDIRVNQTMKNVIFKVLDFEVHLPMYAIEDMHFTGKDVGIINSRTIPNIDESLQEAYDVLRNHGTFLMVKIDRKSIPYVMHHSKTITPSKVNIDRKRMNLPVTSGRTLDDRKLETNVSAKVHLPNRPKLFEPVAYRRIGGSQIVLPSYEEIVKKLPQIIQEKPRRVELSGTNGLLQKDFYKIWEEMGGNEMFKKGILE